MAMSIAAKLEHEGTARRFRVPLPADGAVGAFRRDVVRSVATGHRLEWLEDQQEWQALDSDAAWRRCLAWTSDSTASRTLRLRSSPADLAATTPAADSPQAVAAGGVFRLKTLGGACAGPQWLCDGDEPIARLVTDAPVGALEENLMFTINPTAQPKNPRPIMLRDMKLRPGGRAMLSGMQLYWELDGDNHITVVTEVVRSVDVQGQGTDKLTLTVVTEDTYRVVTSTRVVSVARDAATGGYCWDVEARLRFNCPESFLPAGFTAPAVTGCWQYCDPFWMDIPAPSVAFEGCWEKRGYTRYLMENKDGTVSQAPLNHCWMSNANPPTNGFAADGRLILETLERSNDCACIQFLGQTGPRSVLHLCNWGYDCHLALASLSRDEIWNKGVSPRFKIGLCPPATVASVGQKAGPVPPLKVNGLTALPLYSRSCDFDKMLTLNAPNPDPDLDAWPWMPLGPGCSVGTTTGRTGTSMTAVKITKLASDASVASAWQFEHEGPASWTQRWSDDASIRVSVWCKVSSSFSEREPAAVAAASESGSRDGAFAGGATLGLRWGITNGDQTHPWVFSQRLQPSDGNESSNWTLLTVTLTKPTQDERASGDLQITLRQDGIGQSEFTEFKVVEQGTA